MPRSTNRDKRLPDGLTVLSIIHGGVLASSSILPPGSPLISAAVMAACYVLVQARRR